MLGNQGWMFLSNTKTMVSRIFKDKYFPRRDFLDVVVGHIPSYVWCSIYASQILLKEELRRSTGSGANLCAWGEPWL
ncbi:Putative mitochondrial protein, partial [Glycine soja]